MHICIQKDRLSGVNQMLSSAHKARKATEEEIINHLKNKVMTEKMTPAWVVKKFLPNYETRWSEYRLKNLDDDFDGDQLFHCENEFAWDNFQEALKNLLKKQMETHSRERAGRAYCKECSAFCIELEDKCQGYKNFLKIYDNEKD